MKTIIKYRKILLVLWLVSTVLLTVFQPDINAILEKKGQTALSDSSPSKLADQLLAGMERTEGNNDLIVFYNDNKISQEEMTEIQSSIEDIRTKAEDLGIAEITDPFSLPEAKSRLISEDGTTLMVAFKLEKGDLKLDDIKADLETSMEGLTTQHYLTGEDFINNDYLKSSISGVEKSAALTVIFILVILILMFRSVTAPVVSLLTVGVTYLCSMGIAAQLIEKLNFPVTTLTQVLLVLILFGIGTDYNILLFNRFKEELYHGLSVDEALIQTYKTAGKTIVFSILTVLIAFISLIFAESAVYRSGVVVVIGAAVLLLQILTLTPFVLKTLGERLFWPSGKLSGHNESRVWNKAAKVATKWSILTSILILLAIAPMVILHQQKLNFDTVGELGDSFESAKGFYILQDHFGKGQAMPLSIVISNDSAMDNNQDLAVVDELTEKIRSIKGVSSVSSATQPEGIQIDSFYVGNDLSSVTEGLASAKDGIDAIYNGIAGQSISTGGGDLSQVSQLPEGTRKLSEGVGALASGLTQIRNGIENDASNGQDIISGLSQIKSNLNVMSTGIQALSDGYNQMQTGFVQTGTAYQDLVTVLMQTKNTLLVMGNLVDSLGAGNPGLYSDTTYLALQQASDAMTEGLSGITTESVDQLNASYGNLTQGLASANRNLAAMSAGMAQMSQGVEALERGLKQSGDGLETIITNMDQVKTGLDQLTQGQEQLAEGLSGLSTLGDSMTQMADGLSQISDGIGQANDFLGELTSVKSFYIPEEGLVNEDYQKALDSYMSEDRQTTKLLVVLKDDPYSKNAIQTVEDIQNTLDGTLDTSALKDSSYGISGVSATTKDMNDVLSSDLNRMIIIVIAGIFLVLLAVIRAFWPSLCITLSLVGAYFTAIYLSNFLFIDLMGYKGLNSFIPFFAFIIIVALGVDYSIFLMVRYMEYHEHSPKEGIVRACRHIGGVVTGAVIILGGTFATLIPSGLTILIELAVTVIIGLAALCFVLLPIFLPAMIVIPERLKSILERIFKKDKSNG